MKIAYFLACFLPLTLAQAVDVRWNFSDFTTAPEAVKQVRIQPIYNVTTSGTNIVVSDQIVRVTGTNGSATVSNILAGYAYRVTLAGNYAPTVFTNYFDAGVTGLVSAASYLIVPTNYWPASLAYSRAQADARFAPIGGGGGTNCTPYTFANTNLLAGLVVTNGTTVLIGTNTGTASLDTNTVNALIASAELSYGQITNAPNAITNGQEVVNIAGDLKIYKSVFGAEIITTNDPANGSRQLAIKTGTGGKTVLVQHKTHSSQPEGEYQINCGQYGSAMFYLSALNENAYGLGGNAFIRSSGITLNWDDNGVISIVGDKSGGAWDFNDNLNRHDFTSPVYFSSSIYGNGFGITNIASTNITGLGTAAYSNSTAFAASTVTNLTAGQLATIAAALTNASAFAPSTVTNLTAGQLATIAAAVTNNASPTLTGLSVGAQTAVDVNGNGKFGGVGHTNGVLTGDGSAMANVLLDKVPLISPTYGSWDSTYAAGIKVIPAAGGSQIGPIYIPTALFKPTTNSRIVMAMQYWATNGTTLQNAQTAFFMSNNVKQQIATTINIPVTASNLVWVYSTNLIGNLTNCTGYNVWPYNNATTTFWIYPSSGYAFMVP